MENIYKKVCTYTKGVRNLPAHCVADRNCKGIPSTKAQKKEEEELRKHYAELVKKGENMKAKPQTPSEKAEAKELEKRFAEMVKEGQRIAKEELKTPAGRKAAAENARVAEVFNKLFGGSKKPPSVAEKETAKTWEKLQENLAHIGRAVFRSGLREPSTPPSTDPQSPTYSTDNTFGPPRAPWPQSSGDSNAGSQVFWGVYDAAHPKGTGSIFK